MDTLEQYRSELKRIVEEQNEEVERYTKSMSTWQARAKKIVSAFIDEALRYGGVTRENIFTKEQLVIIERYNRTYELTFDHTTIIVGIGTVTLSLPDDYIGHPEVNLCSNGSNYSIVFHSEKYYITTNKNRGSLDKYDEFDTTYLTKVLYDCAANAER